MRLRSIAVVVLAFVATTQSALAGPVGPTDIKIHHFTFSPKAAKGHALDSTVTWTNRDPFPHTATSDLEYFDTGDLAPSETRSVSLAGAGKHKYHCAIHPPMKGTISLPMISDLDVVGQDQPFELRWNTAMPVGFAADVQELAPGKTKFKTILEGQTDSTEVQSRLKSGKYKYRARIVNLGTHKATGYSKPITVKVTHD